MSVAEQPRADRQLPALFALLLLTTTILLLWGHFRPLDQDEMFVLQTDSVGSIAKLVDVQRHTPISLDPLFYHLLGHVSVSLFGATAFGIRLPSLFGFLLMQVCVFLVGSRMAGTRAGWVAAAIPALTATLFYGVQARPYGVLLGLTAWLLRSWLRATRDAGKPRNGALILLAVTLSLALNTHYFAILLLAPLFGAELVRIVDRTRHASRLQIDWPVMFSIVAGTAGEVFALPFQQAAGEFRKHYYNAGQVGWHAVTQSYRALLINYTDYPLALQRVVGVLLLIGALLLLLAILRRFRVKPTSLHDVAHPLVALSGAEWAFLMILAALPFGGFLLARFVTHSIEVRYVLPGLLGIALLIALMLRPALAHFSAAPVLLLLLIAVAGAERVREERHRLSEFRVAAAVSPEVRAWLQRHEQGRLFVQNTGHFEEALPFLTDPLLRSRTTLLYSAPREIEWLGHDTGALTALHLRAFSTVPVQRYEDLHLQAGDALFVLYPPSGWDWLQRDLPAGGVMAQQVGGALGGDAFAVPLHSLKGDGG